MTFVVAIDRRDVGRAYSQAVTKRDRAGSRFDH
jgi:hypothetical protein